MTEAEKSERNETKAEIPSPMKGGRPRKEIKRVEFEKLCGIQCTEKEICQWFGTTDKTLNRWCRDTYGKGFSDTYKIFSADGKIALRRIQFRLAERSAAMAIFLGKNILGQTDSNTSERVDTLPDDGFISALNAQAEEVFADGTDIPQGAEDQTEATTQREEQQK